MSDFRDLVTLLSAKIITPELFHQKVNSLYDKLIDALKSENESEIEDALHKFAKSPRYTLLLKNHFDDRTVIYGAEMLSQDYREKITEAMEGAHSALSEYKKKLRIDKFNVGRAVVSSIYGISYLDPINEYTVEKMLKEVEQFMTNYDLEAESLWDSEILPYLETDILAISVWLEDALQELERRSDHNIQLTKISARTSERISERPSFTEDDMLEARLIIVALTLEQKKIYEEAKKLGELIDLYEDTVGVMGSLNYNDDLIEYYQDHFQ